MVEVACQLNPKAIYAEGVDSSNYIEKVSPVIRNVLADVGDLLDVGAGGGQLGCSLHCQGKEWVAIEPDPYMCNRLSSYPNCTRIVATGWEEADYLANQSFDTVLAANMIAPQVAAVNFLERCRFWSRKAIVWIVPSQRGPRRLCLSGCLPCEWADESDETGYERVMSQLAPEDYPNHTLTVDWLFTYITKDIDGVAEHTADQLGWDKMDSRRVDIRHHFYSKALVYGDSYHLQVPKQSTVLIWSS